MGGRARRALLAEIKRLKAKAAAGPELGEDITRLREQLAEAKREARNHFETIGRQARKIELMRAARAPLSQAEWTHLAKCLHPDGKHAVSDDARTKAMQILNEHKEALVAPAPAGKAKRKAV